MDGNYWRIGPAKPMGQKRLFQIELWFRKHGHKHIASVMARWDERKLGR